MIKEVIKRIENLDADLSPNKVCVLFHDLLTRGERNAIRNKTFITAFGNYLQDEIVFNSLETMTRARVFNDMSMAAV